MNSPCVRIEILYADGSRNVAHGDRAEAIVEWLRACQALAIATSDVINRQDPPQFTFLDPSSLAASVAGKSDAEESAADAR